MMTDPRPVRPGTAEEPPPTPEEIASQGRWVVLPPWQQATLSTQGKASETFVEKHPGA